MKFAARIMGAAMLAGAMAMAVAPAAVEAKPKSTAASASKHKPGAPKYSNRPTKRAPARSAASVLKARDAANAWPRNYIAYKAKKGTGKKSAVKSKLSKGKSAKSITNKARPGLFSRIGNWFRSLIGSKPKASARKVTFRSERVSAVIPRMGRTPSGQLIER
ncbi:hypothetical protein [Erythrobacter sp. THAF29]|uniref:hypothetical protein n=1 Tax=Erythrobacter sp. THAF29 TaxID=2587851 RepID=UPI0012683F9A|nr:hypothetical protein [Erythrobacter sp. THAF29]QFT78663.1 hypothetical protein FIU90_14025 [Erythrobacter sp. THAF29]